MPEGIKLQKSTFFNEKDTKKRLSDFISAAKFLSMGEMCAKFEKEFAMVQKRRHAVFVSSGSAANLILIQAMLNLKRLKRGDTIAVSGITWATNVMPLIQLGLKPMPLDCELSNLNVSSQILASAKRKKIKALFLTNVLGFSADIGNIRDYCEENNIIFLEDNCESLGSRVRGRLLGNFGLASTFSTFVGHHMSTVEGGFVCTDDEELYNMLLMIRAHGWDRNLSEDEKSNLRKKHNVSEFHGKYTFYTLAYNVRPTEIQGFLGLTQLESIDKVFEKREENFYEYLEATRTNDDIVPLDIGHMSFVSNFAMPVIFKTDFLFKKYKDRFLSKNVEIRPIISGNITRQPFFKEHVRETVTLKNSDIVHERGFYFANNAELTKREVKLLCNLLEN